MREIKFRIWDNDNNKMIYDVRLPIRFDDVGWMNPIKTSPNVEVMQFTGLLDRNGNEIYEGDIIHAKFNMSRWFHMNVVWKDGGFCLNNRFKDNEYICIMQRNCEDWGMEVVGNIHEKEKTK